MADPKPTRRSFYPTPAWLVLGLLVVEGLLRLSERYRWFWFNERKGWTVLIALAVVGVAMLVMLGWFIVALVCRWRFQFSIRSLLVLVVVVAVPCSWLAMEMRQAKQQRDAVAAIRELGGRVAYDYELDASGTFSETPGPTAPVWLRSLLGDDFFGHVHTVFLEDDSKITDAGLDNLKELNQIRALFLGNTEVTDAGLETLTGLNKLECLDLVGTKITDAGLGNLYGLNQLRKLVLANAVVTDVGSWKLGTKVTDAGVKKLQQALPKCEIIRRFNYEPDVMPIPPLVANPKTLGSK